MSADDLPEFEISFAVGALSYLIRAHTERTGQRPRQINLDLVTWNLIKAELLAFAPTSPAPEPMTYDLPGQVGTFEGLPVIVVERTA